MNCILALPHVCGLRFAATHVPPRVPLGLAPLCGIVGARGSVLVPSTSQTVLNFLHFYHGNWERKGVKYEVCYWPHQIYSFQQEKLFMTNARTRKNYLCIQMQVDEWTLILLKGHTMLLLEYVSEEYKHLCTLSFITNLVVEVFLLKCLFIFLSNMGFQGLFQSFLSPIAKWIVTVE